MQLLIQSHLASNWSSGRNPPFGHQLLKKLESFPNLRVSVKETGRDVRVGKGATIKVLAEIGFLNDVLPQVFNRKPFSVCFLVEDSNGSLVEFRRFKPKKLDHGERVYLTLRLTKPTSHVNCYVVCDEIAGTSKYAELNLSNIPTSVYPPQRTEDKTGDSTRTRCYDDEASKDWGEEFDDGGINDQDLLALETDGTKIEVVEDIDALFDADEKKKRTKASKPEHDEDGDIAAYREPTQLANGRWTCQHDCNERDKQCKHKCCKEGVSKPRRKPKVEPKIKEEKGQKKITSMATVKAKVKPTEGLGIKAESKAQRKLGNLPATNSESKRNGKRTRSFAEFCDANPRSSSNATSSSHEQHSAEPAAKRLRLSKGRDQNDGDQRFWDVDFESEDTKEDARPTSLEKQDQNAGTGEDDLFSWFDEDDLLDFSFKDTQVLDDYQSVRKDTPQVENHAKPADPSTHEDKCIAPDDDEWDPLTSDVDLGGFEPPLKHVSMSDVLKKGTSPGAAQSGMTIQEPHHVGDRTGLDWDFFDIPAGVTDLPPDQMEECVTTCDHEDITPNVDTPADSLVETPGAEELNAVAHAGANFVTNMHSEETDAEREKRLYEEDQKKKWEGIDQWIYDEFHQYVELV